jgi:dienelactone hydrolase
MRRRVAIRGAKARGPSARRAPAISKVAVIGALIVALGGCNGDVLLGRSQAAPAPEALPLRAHTVTTSPPVTPEGTYRVRTSRIMIAEPAGVGRPDRLLPTEVWIPMPSRPTARRPGKARPPYPVVVFSQGYDLSVAAYSGLLAGWSSAGFVVAAPTYPHTDPSDPAELNESDIINHPSDLRFVISMLVRLAHQPHSVLFGLIDDSEIGIAGHSDGGDVTLAVADNSCCRDTAVKAVAVFSGAELDSFGGTYFRTPSPPLLVVQGNEDTINFPVCSTQIYDSAKGTKFYLDLLGAQHEPPYAGPLMAPKADRGIVARVTTYFFDAELADEPAALAALRSAGAVPGVASIRQGGTAPTEPGRCPGAPA